MGTEVLIPEQRNMLQKGFGMIGSLSQINFGNLSQGWGMAKEGFGKLFSAGSAGATGGSGGGSAAAVTGGINPTAMETVGEYAPYAAPVAAAAGYYADSKSSNGAHTAPPLGQGGSGQQQMNTVGKVQKAAPTILSGGLNQIKGLGLTENPSDPAADGMSAMERRYTTQQTAMTDLEDAQKELGNAGLPLEEKRRINQKLELARQQIGAPRNGRTNYSAKA
jgi:hypothetical protein